MLDSTSTANPVFYRTYSRRTEFGRESWEQVCDRTLKALERLGRLTLEEIALITKNMKNMKSLPSGRWLWVGGTEWLENPSNFSGAYNCTSTNLTGWNSLL
jgi:ribonucleotide reductase class II